MALMKGEWKNLKNITLSIFYMIEVRITYAQMLLNL